MAGVVVGVGAASEGVLDEDVLELRGGSEGPPSEQAPTPKAIARTSAARPSARPAGAVEIGFGS